MKKIASAFLAIAAAAAPVAINAQEASSKFVLTDIEDQEWGESVVFTYNNQELSSIHFIISFFSPYFNQYSPN